MSDLKKILSEEMRRLARKEIKAEVEPLTRKILELKKVVSVLSKELKTSKTAALKATPDDEPAKEACEDKKLSSSKLGAAAIRRIRENLGISQLVFGKLIGASLLSVSHWELGNSSPRPKFKVRILSLKSLGKRGLKKLLEEKNITFSASRSRKKAKPEQPKEASPKAPEAAGEAEKK